MVVDTLDNLEKYVSLHPLFEKMIMFIKQNNLSSLNIGKHLIEGEDFFVNIQEVTGKTKEEAMFETHRRMIDVQIPLDSREIYGYAPLSALPEAEYNVEKDITKYANVQAETFVNCKPGEFVIFWPEDGHQPCIGEGKFHKAIFKVRL